MAGGEPVADLVVRTSDLRATRVDGGVVPRAIDELPLVAILGCFAQGDTVIAGAAELRVKESDRVEAVVRVLGSMGADITPRDDGFVVHGPCRLTGATVDAGGDHRVGMLAAIAGALATDTTEVVHDAVGVSYPRFWDDLRDASLGGVAAR
jgi:3-phosphoshikimate 1-carboxyvinyltransferase